MTIILKLSITLLLILVSTNSATAHGGRLDSQGGHNCRVGYCAGTYHCHKPLSTFCKEQLGLSGAKKKSKK